MLCGLLTAAMASKKPGHPTAEQNPKSDKLCVLVVEDDELVREATVGNVMDLGHRVLEAADADGALQMLDSGTVIDVLFTDVRLPGKNGEQLAREAWQRQPELKVIFTSGGPVPEERPAATGMSIWLGKPYTWTDLKRAFDELHPRRE